MAFLWLINGVTDYLLNGMILQVDVALVGSQELHLQKILNKTFEYFQAAMLIL